MGVCVPSTSSGLLSLAVLRWLLAGEARGDESFGGWVFGGGGGAYRAWATTML